MTRREALACQARSDLLVFDLLDKLLRSGDGARVLEFVRQLLDRFDAVFP